MIESAAGGPRRVVVKNGFGPVFSPNGKLIAFERNLGTTPKPRDEILTVPVKGGKTHLVAAPASPAVGIAGLTGRR